jgi:hypothetical protein
VLGVVPDCEAERGAVLVVMFQIVSKKGAFPAQVLGLVEVRFGFIDKKFPCEMARDA